MHPSRHPQHHDLPARPSGNQGSGSFVATITDPLDVCNFAPTITSAAAASVPENQTSAIDVEATDDNDSEGAGLTYNLSGGADDALFSIEANTGVVTFDTAPDFEAPGDQGGDDTYDIQVTVTESGGKTAVQDIAITVTDADEIAPTAGEVRVTSEFAFDETRANLIGALESNPNIRILATVDHAAAAAANGLELDPNRVVLFGNPNLGTPLMQANQTAGIDLPQKMHVTEQRGRVVVSYNSPHYLVDRHRLVDVATIDTIAGARASFAEAAAGRTPVPPRNEFRWYRYFDGLQTRSSDAGFETTWNRLMAAIEASSANVAFTVDHGANAAANGLELRPTRLVVFGNPNLGTQLMESSPSPSIDLPLKILVWKTQPDRCR